MCKRTLTLTMAALVLTLAGCSRSSSEVGDGTGSMPNVEVVRPQWKTLRRVVEQPGAIYPQEEALLFARVPGYVAKVHRDIGDKVRGPKGSESGEILAEIAAPELVEEAEQKKALVRQSEADVEQAEKALAAAEANIVTTEAAVAEAKAGEERWLSESKRIASMVRNGVLDVQARDETRNQYKASAARVQATEASVKKAHADRDKAKADVRSVRARVDVACAEARRLEALVGYCKIRAPFDGVVTRRKLNTGDLVHPGAGKSDWLFGVAMLNPVRVVVDVAESEAGLVEENSEVSLNIPATRGPAVACRVKRTSWALAHGSRTLRAEMELANDKGKLRPGMYVYAKISGEQSAGWLLPNSALAKQGDAMVAFLIEDGKALRVVVQVGASDGKQTEVLRWQRVGATAWSEWSGKEDIASKTAGLSDGQTVQRGG